MFPKLLIRIRLMTTVLHLYTYLSLTHVTELLLSLCVVTDGVVTPVPSKYDVLLSEKLK